MGYLPVRYDSRVVNYDLSGFISFIIYERKMFIRLATGYPMLVRFS